MPLCPSCSSSDIVKNGRIHNAKQRFKCQECGRQFVEHSQKKVIGSATRELIDRLLLERISLAGIARAVQVSEVWLQRYVNEKYASVPRRVQVSPKKRGGVSVSMRRAMVIRGQ
jgi:transposase-like protein